MLLLYTLALFFFSSVQVCNALVARASLPPSFTVKELGLTTESNSTFDRVSRDGGGGGLVNGNHLIVFSDTGTTNSNDQLIGFTSNSVVFSNANDPTSLTDFGQNGVPYLGIPFLANESAWTTANSAAGKRMIIWPQSSIAPLTDGVSGVAVYNVAELSSDGSSVPLYNTMVRYTPNSSGPHATRAVPQMFYVSGQSQDCSLHSTKCLFQNGETQYGSFCNVVSKNAGKLLLIAKTPVDSFSAGLKVAKVDPDYATDRTKYSYWDGSEWSSTPVPPSSTAGNLFTNYAGLSSGDLLYSAYLGTWIFIYFDNFASNTFYMRYSTNGFVTGQDNWSDQVTLYETTPASSSQYNYAAHAYSGYDASGKTVLLSWTYGGGQTKLATVTFA